MSFNIKTVGNQANYKLNLTANHLMRRLEDCSSTGKATTRVELLSILTDELDIEFYGEFLPNVADDALVDLVGISTDGKEMVVAEHTFDSTANYSILKVFGWGYLSPESLVSKKRPYGWFILPHRALLAQLRLAAQKGVKVLDAFQKMLANGGSADIHSPLDADFLRMDHELVDISEDARIVSFRTLVGADRYVTSFAHVQSWGMMHDHPLKFYAPNEGHSLFQSIELPSELAMKNALKVPEISIFAVVQYEDNGLSNKGRPIMDHPEIFRRFKEMTKGQMVVMGRNTFEKYGNKFDEGTMICVLTRRTEPSYSPKAAWFSSIEDILTIRGPEKIYVIGGQGLYEDFLRSAKHVTLVKVDVPDPVECDSYFPDLPGNWEVDESATEMIELGSEEAIAVYTHYTTKW